MVLESFFKVLLCRWWNEGSLLHLAAHTQNYTHSYRGAEHTRTALCQERQVLSRLGENAEGYGYMLTAAECGCIEAQLYLAMVRLTGCVGEPDIISIRRIPFHRPDTPDTAFLLPPVPGEDGEYADELMDKRFEIVEADEYEAIRYIRKAARHQGDYVGNAVGNAEFLLAKCAEEGVGRMYDRAKAIELYVRAAEHGSYDAFKKLKTLPAYDVEQARARLRMKPANDRKRIGESDVDEDD